MRHFFNDFNNPPGLSTWLTFLVVKRFIFQRGNFLLLIGSWFESCHIGSNTVFNLFSRTCLNLECQNSTVFCEHGFVTNNFKTFFSGRTSTRSNTTWKTSKRNTAPFYPLLKRTKVRKSFQIERHSTTTIHSS